MASDKVKKGKKKTGLIILLVFVIIVALCFAAVWMVVKSYLGKIDYDDGTGNEQVENSLTDDEILEELLRDEEVTDESDSPQDAIDQLESQMQEQVKDPEVVELLSDPGVYNIMLIGCDSREKSGVGRSDAMILVSINKNKEKIQLTSIMRDSYVTIPEKGNNRINAAYAFGGGNLLVDTVETNFGIEVDKYVAFDFYSFIDVVDILGGIEVDVSEEEMPILNGYVRDLNGLNGRDIGDFMVEEPGMQHLNGTQALGYSRIRHTGNGDFERTERQKEVISALFSKVKNMSLGELDKLLNAVLPEIKTNLTEDEILSLFLNVLDYLLYDLESLRLPVDGSYETMRVNKMSVLGIDLDKNHAALEEFIYSE